MTSRPTFRRWLEVRVGDALACSASDSNCVC